MKQTVRIAACVLMYGFTGLAAPGAAAEPAGSPGIGLVAAPGGGTVPTVLRGPRESSVGRGAGAVFLENGDFSAGLSSWKASRAGGGLLPGEVKAEAGGALLSEGDSFLVTLEQTFVVPEDAGTLAFRLVLDPGFDVSADFIPDAFEVSLLDAANLPVVGTWDPLATSSFNLAEGGAVHAAPGAAWDGSMGRIALHSVPPGTTVTLYFDLIGADDDFEGGLRLDDVEIESGPAPGDFVRGNANADLRVDISDAIFTLGYLFLGSGEPICLDAADSNNDSLINITDPIYSLNFLFLGGPAIPPPYPECGSDAGPTDLLGCGEGACPE